MIVLNTGHSPNRFCYRTFRFVTSVSFDPPQWAGPEDIVGGVVPGAVRHRSIPFLDGRYHSSTEHGRCHFSTVDGLPAGYVSSGGS